LVQVDFDSFGCHQAGLRLVDTVSQRIVIDCVHGKYTFQLCWLSRGMGKGLAILVSLSAPGISIPVLWWKAAVRTRVPWRGGHGRKPLGERPGIARPGWVSHTAIIPCCTALSAANWDMTNY
jgi:hypothetical protein